MVDLVDRDLAEMKCKLECYVIGDDHPFDKLEDFDSIELLIKALKTQLSLLSSRDSFNILIEWNFDLDRNRFRDCLRIDSYIGRRFTKVYGDDVDTEHKINKSLTEGLE